MARPVHPEAMAPARPGRTRTAPPRAPSGWYSQPRMRTYLLFDATGIVYLIAGLVALRVAWALGSGPAAWQAMQERLAQPLYVLFHLVALVSVVFVGARFFRLFPKAQPPRIGPVKPPPQPVIFGALYAAWIVVAGALTLVLAGGIVR